MTLKLGLFLAYAGWIVVRLALQFGVIGRDRDAARAALASMPYPILGLDILGSLAILVAVGILLMGRGSNLILGFALLVAVLATAGSFLYRRRA